MQQDHETDRLKELISAKRMISQALSRQHNHSNRVALQNKLVHIEKLIESCKQHLAERSEKYLMQTVEAVNERQRISDEYNAIKLKHEKRRQALAKAKAKAEKLQRRKKYEWIFDLLAWGLIGGTPIVGGIFVLYNVAMFFSGEPMWIPFYE